MRIHRDDRIADAREDRTQPAPILVAVALLLVQLGCLRRQFIGPGCEFVIRRPELSTLARAPR